VSLLPFSFVFIYLFFQFANVHDISWGTKGDNAPPKELGAVTKGKTGEVEAEVPTDEKDIDSLYEDAIHVLNTKAPVVERKPDPKTQQEDYYRTFRTK
jgi:chitin synthase